MPPTVLVLNCGSSSVKFQVIEPDVETPARDRDRRLARGAVADLGDQTRVTLQVEGQPPRRSTEAVHDHQGAIQRILEWIGSADFQLAGSRAGVGFDAVGHRVVHGGERFTESVLIDDEVMAAIEQLEELAPLHNAPSLKGVRAARATLGARIPMVAVFDTAFHATLPEHACRYAIPYDLSLRHGIRRFGFHGTSYRFVLARYCDLTGTPREQATIVALHLGNGCSVTAIEGGRSVDTSMGFTPLEGLLMGTRSGDLDPSLVRYLATREGISVDEVETLLNERSGLLGLSGLTNDMRELLSRAREYGDSRAQLAVEMFCYRARKYIGSYLAALGSAQAVVFTGGIGENAPEVRARICKGLEWWGLAIDLGRNSATVGIEGRISRDDARLHAYVIPTDEELLIARDTARCLRGFSAPSPF